MTVIKSINDLIEKSMKNADCCIPKAIKWKDTYPTLARALYEASLDEMTHVSRLHDEVVKIIQDYNEKHGKPPEVMQAVYDYLHEKHIEYAAEIKGLQGMYKAA